jgi:hypothetical protein
MKTSNARIADALQVLTQLGMPSEQLNTRTAICLLALLNLTPETQWKHAERPLLGIRDLLDFARNEYQIMYAENTRESFRKYSVKQLISAGIVVHNPDKPDRPINSSDNCYQVEAAAFELFKSYGTSEWMKLLRNYMATHLALAKKYAKERDKFRVPIKIKKNQKITLSAGPHSDLIRAIIENFGENFVPGGELVYVGDTGEKWGYVDMQLLSSLRIVVDQHGKMPDVVIYDRNRNWLLLIEAVASSGPVDAGRHDELSDLFSQSTAGLVYVTAFPDRGTVFRKFLSLVAWETEVWCASDPTHLIHFNGERFLGPY